MMTDFSQLVFCLLQGWVERVVHSELGIELSCDGTVYGNGDVVVHITKLNDSLFGFGGVQLV